jgi:hypothetical protein
MTFFEKRAFGMDVNKEVEHLQREIVRLGKRDSKDQKIKVAYGVLFKDDKVANTFEALMGTLKSAKKKKIIHFEGELLLQNVHDKVDIVLLVEPAAAH